MTKTDKIEWIAMSKKTYESELTEAFCAGWTMATCKVRDTLSVDKAIAEARKFLSDLNGVKIEDSES